MNSADPREGMGLGFTQRVAEGGFLELLLSPW